MNPVIESKSAPAKQTKDVFLLMVRYGATHWATCSSHDSLESAVESSRQVKSEDGQEAWRIIAVRDLPLRVSPGEV